MKSQTDWVCAFIWPRSCIYWPLSAVRQTKVENLHQPSKYGQNLAGDQPGWSLLDSLSAGMLKAVGGIQISHLVHLIRLKLYREYV